MPMSLVVIGVQKMKVTEDFFWGYHGLVDDDTQSGGDEDDAERGGGVEAATRAALDVIRGLVVSGMPGV